MYCWLMFDLLLFSILLFSIFLQWRLGSSVVRNHPNMAEINDPIILYQIRIISYHIISYPYHIISYHIISYIYNYILYYTYIISIYIYIQYIHTICVCMKPSRQTHPKPFHRLRSWSWCKRSLRKGMKRSSNVWCDQCFTNASPMLHQCFTNASPMLQPLKYLEIFKFHWLFVEMFCPEVCLKQLKLAPLEPLPRLLNRWLHGRDDPFQIKMMHSLTSKWLSQHKNRGQKVRKPSSRAPSLSSSLAPSGPSVPSVPSVPLPFFFFFFFFLASPSATASSSRTSPFSAATSGASGAASAAFPERMTSDDWDNVWGPEKWLVNGMVNMNVYELLDLPGNTRSLPH